jgi:glyoxylase-like metal-dependent hydrolase (beta-lactamase superfamily II)
MTSSALSRRGFCACCAGLAAWPIAARAAETDPASEGLPPALELGEAGMTRIARTVWVKRIAPGLWLHTNTALIEGGFYFPANGLVLEREGGALLIDTCNEPEQAETLLAWSKKALARPITEAVATHFHLDRTGGIHGLEHHGVPTRAHPATVELTLVHSLPTPRPIDGFKDGAFPLGPDCELFFPGAGHTRDNIVAWLPRQSVLFGGCLLKSQTANGLGNVRDAVVGEWAATVRRVMAHYPQPRLVVPGHGTVHGDPLGHTLALVAAGRA